MNSSNDTEATKSFAKTEEIAERWQTIKKLFESASALTGNEREKFLEDACGEDTALRLEVEKLLASFEDSDTFLEKPAAAEMASGARRKFPNSTHI